MSAIAFFPSLVSHLQNWFQLFITYIHHGLVGKGVCVFLSFSKVNGSKLSFGENKREDWPVFGQWMAECSPTISQLAIKHKWNCIEGRGVGRRKGIPWMIVISVQFKQNLITFPDPIEWSLCHCIVSLGSHPNIPLLFSPLNYRLKSEGRGTQTHTQSSVKFLPN